MIFSEIYSAYYSAVSAILSAVLDGEVSEKELRRIASEHAFGESAPTVMSALKSEKWQLLHSDMTTPVRHRPSVPLTAVEKSWLKAIFADPRIKLFGAELPDLEGVEPLFDPSDIYIYDKYGDGDPFEDEVYIRNFRTVLEAIHNGTQIEFEMLDRCGNRKYGRGYPMRLEYSEKDDKFRVINADSRGASTVNLARMLYCAHYVGEGRKYAQGSERDREYGTVTVRITDERNALERFMLAFAHFEKQAEKEDEKHYTVNLRYAFEDEAEMVIRILSFGPMAMVVGSEKFKNAVINKLKKQISCGLK